MNKPVDLLLGLRLVTFVGNEVKPIVIRQSLSIPSNKLLSPGIRQMCVSDLYEFLDSACNKACNLPPDTLDSRLLIAAELRSLAELIEKGERVSTSTIKTLDDGDIHIELVVKPPQPT